jgi:nitrate reductase delta subunit
MGLMREALTKAQSPYARVIDAVLATLPAMTPEIARRMAELARTGPPVETVGLEPFPTAPRPYASDALTPTGAAS